MEWQYCDPDERLAATGRLILPLYSYDLCTRDLEIEDHDARGYAETWADMLRLQGEGVYPAALSAIDAAVLMLHGEFDPHPGAMIRDGLRPVLPQLQYHQWPRCGHYPWLERAVYGEFFTMLREWLKRNGQPLATLT